MAELYPRYMFKRQENEEVFSKVLVAFDILSSNG